MRAIGFEPTDHALRQHRDHQDEQTALDEQPALGPGLRHQALGIHDHNGAEDRPHERAAAAHGHPNHHLNGEGNSHVLRRNDAGLHGEQRPANAGQTTGNGKHDGLEQGGIEAGEAQPWFVITNGDQHIAEAAPHHPAHKQPSQKHQHAGEPEEVPLHLWGPHHLTKQLGHIGFEAIGAIDQLLLPVEEVEKHQQRSLGEDREVDPLDAVAEHHVPQQRSQQCWHQPDGNQREQRVVKRLPEKRQLINAVQAEELRDAVRLA